MFRYAIFKMILLSSMQLYKRLGSASVLCCSISGHNDEKKDEFTIPPVVPKHHLAHEWSLEFATSQIIWAISHSSTYYCFVLLQFFRKKYRDKFYTCFYFSTSLRSLNRYQWLYSHDRIATQSGLIVEDLKSYIEIFLHLPLQTYYSPLIDLITCH